MHTTQAPPNGRGCGERTEGGLYLCTGFSPFGKTIDYFVNDPGEINDRIEFSRAPQLIGTETLMGEIVDVYMHVGANEGYRAPWVHITETGTYGLSRKISSTFPFDQLQPTKSLVYLIYPYGIPLFDFEVGDMFFDQAANPEDDLDIAYPLCHIPISTDNYHPDSQRRPGNHDQIKNVPKNVQERADNFCTFAHRDLAYWLVNDDQRTLLNEEAGVFSITVASTMFEGIVPKIITDKCDTNDHAAVSKFVRNKKNWHPAILMQLPITHFEIPHGWDHIAKLEQTFQKINEAGYSFVVTNY